MIHGPGHYSDEYKVLGELGTKYIAAQPTKDRGSNPIPRKGYHKKQENHTIIDNVMDVLCMVEFKKVSAVNHEAPEFLESDYDENDLYQVENMSLDENEYKLNNKSVRLNMKVHMLLKIDLK